MTVVVVATLPNAKVPAFVTKSRTKAIRKMLTFPPFSTPGGGEEKELSEFSPIQKVAVTFTQPDRKNGEIFCNKNPVYKWLQFTFYACLKKNPI